MSFTRMDYLVDACKKHLDDTGSRNTEVEAFLVGYLLVRATAEFEQCFRRICEVRAERAGDEHLARVVSDWGYIKRARMNISDLSGSIGLFGPDYAASFKGFKDDSSNAMLIAGWDSIHSHRTTMAHGSGVALNLNDFEMFYQRGKRVLEAVATSISLDAAQFAALEW